MPITDLNCNLVDEGRMISYLDDAISRIGQKVVQSYGDHGEARLASGEVNLKIRISKDPKFERFFRVEYEVVEKEPKRPTGSISLCTAEKGVLKVQDAGGGQHDNIKIIGAAKVVSERIKVALSGYMVLEN